MTLLVIRTSLQIFSTKSACLRYHQTPMNSAPSNTSPGRPTSAILRFEEVHRRFPGADADGRRDVLDGVSFSLARGEVATLVGRSGAGKTTLLHLAGGLLRPTAGSIFFDGDDISRQSAASLARLRRRRIGLVFQNSLTLAALPVWENAALTLLMEGMPRRQARAAAAEALERVGLAPYAARSTAVLSGGQRRRLGLARCLLAQPELVLADEPTADLDDETAAMIENFLFDWLSREGRAALIVTHEASIIEKSSRILRLDSGRLEQTADPGTIRSVAD